MFRLLEIRFPLADCAMKQSSTKAFDDLLVKPRTFSKGDFDTVQLVNSNQFFSVRGSVSKAQAYVPTKSCRRLHQGFTWDFKIREAARSRGSASYEKCVFLLASFVCGFTSALRKIILYGERGYKNDFLRIPPNEADPFWDGVFRFSTHSPKRDSRNRRGFLGESVLFARLRSRGNLPPLGGRGF